MNSKLFSIVFEVRNVSQGLITPLIRNFHIYFSILKSIPGSRDFPGNSPPNPGKAGLSFGTGIGNPSHKE